MQISVAASPVAVLGAGAWGTALAVLLAKNAQPVRLWGYDPAQITAMQKTRCNDEYLPGITLSENITLSAELAVVLQDVRDVLIVTPSFAFPQVVTQIKPYLHAQNRFICATKGLEPETGQLLHIVTQQILVQSYPFAVLAGPSFAQEVAIGKPTAITLATQDEAFAEGFSARLNNPYFRVYTTHDVIGVEICGAVKNILAIVAGIIYGMDLGMNALSAMVTRGLAEMQRLGVAIGGKPSTFMGMAGVGDLILTCTGNLSRNRRFGMGIAQGKSPQQVLQEIGQVVEGLDNLNGVWHLAQHHGVEMPIIEQMHQVIYHGLSVETAIRNLLSRGPKTEGE